MNSTIAFGAGYVDSGHTKKDAEHAKPLVEIRVLEESKVQLGEIVEQKNEQSQVTEKKIDTVAANVTFAVPVEGKSQSQGKKSVSARRRRNSSLFGYTDPFQNTPKSPQAKSRKMEFDENSG